MIQIQLKSGTKFLTNKVDFVILSNIEHVDFWITASDKKSERIEVKVSEIDSMSIDTEGVAAKLRDDIVEVMGSIGNSLDRLKDHLTPRKERDDVVDEDLIHKSSI